MNVQKVPVAPVSLTVVCVDIASRFVACLKPKENQWILHAFDVLDVLVRLFVSNFAFFF